MSLANVRRHWRALAILLLVFLLVAAAGPLIFYGVGPLFSTIVNGSGIARWLLFAIIVAAVPAWIFFMLWAGDKVDHLPCDGMSSDAAGDGHG